MLVQMDARSIVTAVFHQLRRFLLIFVPIVAFALFRVLTATPAYQSDASLLVKFGQDARPEVTIDGGQSSGLSAEEKRGLVQSNLNILTSRDLARALLTDITLEKAYPEIAQGPGSDNAKMNAAVVHFLDDLKTSTLSDAGVINLSLYHTDQALVTEMLSHFLDLFVQKQATIFGNPQTNALSDQVKEAATRLDAANRALSEYKVSNGITSLDEELSLLLRQRSELAGYLARRQDASGTAVQPTTPSPAPESAAETLLSVLTGSSGADTSTESTKTPDVPEQRDALPIRINAQGGSRFPVLEDIQKRIDDLRAKESELLLTYRADSDQVKTIRRNITTEQAALERTVDALSTQIADLDRQISEKQSHRTAYEDLSRQVQLTEGAYKIAQERYQAGLVNDDLNQRKITRISLIQQPSSPEKPSRPNKALIMALAIVVGGGLAAALCLLSELLDQTFISAAQIPAVLRRPLLGCFARRQGVGAVLSRQDLSGLYRSLETALAEQPGNSRVIQLASSYVGEGSGTIADELSQYAADSLKRRVLLVKQTSAVQSALAPTLLDVALGQAPLASALATAGNYHKAVLCPDIQTDLALASLEKLQALLTQLKAHYDLILIPAAGLVQNGAALGLGKLADGVVIVIEAEKTRAPVVQQIIQQMDETGVRLIGAILNKRNFYIPQWLYGRL